MAVFLFYGQEEYLLNKEIKRLKDELLDSAFVSMSYKVFNNPGFNSLLECLQSAPLMFGNTLTVINMDKYLLGNGVSLDDKQIASIDFALSSLNDNVNIIFVCKIPRNENKKPDSRKKFYKTISKYSQVKEFIQYRSYDKNLVSIIQNMAKEKDLKIDTTSISLIIEQLGVNLTLINTEFEKLKTAIYPEKNISKDLIKKYCTSTDDIFILADLIIKGDKNEILKQYNLLTEKRHYLEIFAFLQVSLQKFLFIKNYEKKLNVKELSEKLKMHEFIVQKTIEKLRKISIERLIKIRENLLYAEYKLKSGKVQEDKIFELALLG